MAKVCDFAGGFVQESSGETFLLSQVYKTGKAPTSKKALVARVSIGGAASAAKTVVVNVKLNKVEKKTKTHNIPPWRRPRVLLAGIS